MSFEMYVPDYAARVIERLEKNGYEAYLVGGCVRDSFLGNIPGDYDMTVSSKPEETEKCFDGFRIIETGIKHGTVTVVSEGHNIELTTFRCDGEYKDNRRPETVSFTGDIHEDTARRDFTVNAMAYSPLRGLVDDYGGAEDIENKIIRCVGDAETRFNEDALRIMRGLRFAAVLGFTIEKKTGDAIIRKRELLKNISVERIFTELKKLLTGKFAVPLLEGYRCVFETVIPELSGMSDDEYAAACGFTAEFDTPEECFAAWLSPLSPETAGDICFRLKTDVKFRKTVVFLIENRNTEFPSAGAVRRFAGENGRERLPLLVGFRRKTGAPENTFLTEAAKLSADKNACFSVAELKVSGSDIAALGIRGKAIGETLVRLLEAVADGSVQNEKEPLLGFCREKLAPGGDFK